MGVRLSLQQLQGQGVASAANTVDGQRGGRLGQMVTARRVRLSRASKKQVSSVATREKLILIDVPQARVRFSLGPEAGEAPRRQPNCGRVPHLRT